MHSRQQRAEGVIDQDARERRASRLLYDGGIVHQQDLIECIVFILARIRNLGAMSTEVKQYAVVRADPLDEPVFNSRSHLPG